MTSSGYERLTLLYISTTVLLIVLQAHSLPISEDPSSELKSTNMTAEILDLLSSKGFSGNSSRKVLNSGQGTKLVRCWMRSKLSTGTHQSLPRTTSPLQFPTLSNTSPVIRTVQTTIDRSIRNTLKLTNPRLSNGGTVGIESISAGLTPESCDNGMTYSAFLKRCVAETTGRAPGVG